MQARKTISRLVLLPLLLVLCGAGDLYAQKIRVAVTQLQAKKGLEKDYADLMTDVIRTELFETEKFDVMNREDMVAILGEMKFQESGACESTECAVEMGSALGVQKMVAGSVGKMGQTFVINMKLIDIQSMKNEQLLSEYHKGSEDDLPDTIGKLVKRMAAQVESGTVVKKAPSKSKPAKKVKVKKEKAPRPAGASLWSRRDFRICGITGTVTGGSAILFGILAGGAYKDHEEAYDLYEKDRTDEATVQALYAEAQDKYDSYKMRKTLFWTSLGVTTVCYGYCGYLVMFKRGGSAALDEDPAFYAGLDERGGYQVSYSLKF